MQSMNTDPPTYYSNPAGTHPGQAGIYYPNTVEHFQIPNSNPYSQTQPVPTQYFNPTVPNVYSPHAAYYFSNPYQANGAPASNGQYVPMIRPRNENHTGTQSYVSPGQYGTYANSPMPQQPHMYHTGPYYRFPMTQQYPQQNFSQTTNASQNGNQAPSQYPTTNSQQQAQSSLPHQPTASQQASNDSSHGVSIRPSQSKERRTKKPLLIVDPSTQKALDMQSSTSTSITPSITASSKTADEPEKTQKCDEFRKQFALLLDQPHPQTDKNTSPPSNDDQTDGKSTKDKQVEEVVLQTQELTLNESSEKSQPYCPGIPIRSISEDKSNAQDSNDSQKQIETNVSTPEDTTDNSTNIINHEIVSSDEKNQSETKVPSTNTQQQECATATPEPKAPGIKQSHVEQITSLSARHSYTKEQLLNKRSDPNAQKRPLGLRSIDGVTDIQTARLITPSIIRGGNIPLEKPELHNRSEKPYIRANPNRLDLDEKFLRDVTGILNKVTPQTYEKLLKRLDELEINRYERLEGMITIIFSKAVDERAFCFLYARLCQHFQRKEVTVPDENGNKPTHSFRQLLLTRCQKEFENDYRQEIGYEKRKAEIEVLTDEKVQKEEFEKLEEDLAKAKRKKLGNIFFIGELFKLQMLTERIMYDCIEYLLRDKTDEESLECLCKLINTIGKELDAKTSDKGALNRKKLEAYYTDLENLASHKDVSARIRFMIQDVMDFRKANWVARRAEAKPTTIDEIHEQARLNREQQERDQERDKALRRESNRGGHYGNNNQQYSGSRGSGMKQQSNRMDDEQSGNRSFNVNSVRQLQTNDKRNQGSLSLNLAPQCAWSKGSTVEKKAENDRSNTARNSKPPAVPSSQSRSKTGNTNGPSNYTLQSQSSRELMRENSTESSRKTSTSGITNPSNASMTNSREGSRNVSREQSREKITNDRTQNINATTASSNQTSFSNNNPEPSSIAYDEEKTIGHVHSLIEEYTENYSDDDERPIQEALEDVVGFCTQNIDQQALIVRELITNVLEAKPRARKAIGHLLDIVLHKKIICNDGFLSGFKMVIDLVPDYAVDIPLIWQYIGEILGAFIGGPSPNMLLIKPILQLVSDEKSQQLFKYIIRFAIEISSKARIQKFWQSSGFSLNDLFKSDLMDSSFINEFNWLSEMVTPGKDILLPRPDQQLIKLFKSVNDQGAKVTDSEIIAYIGANMNSNDKFYIRNIVLSYLEACLINREPQKKIQEDIAKSRMAVLKEIIGHESLAEIQAVYAIQNFVHKLEHPPKMAQLLFDIFYDEECVSEDAFFEWLRHPDQSESDGHSIVEMSTKDFFTWLEQAETEEGDEEET